MTAPIHALVFDLDGTLLDTIGDIARCMNGVLAAHGYPQHETPKYHDLIGDGVVKLVERATRDTGADPSELAAMAAELQAEYDKGEYQTTRPYDGIPELLEAAEQRGLSLNVLSNKPHPHTRLAIRHFFREVPWQEIRGALPSVPRKPDPSAALDIAERIGVQPRHTLYVGDTDTDMKTARAARMFAVGAVWGYRSADELRAHGARFLAEEPMDLLTLLNGA